MPFDLTMKAERDNSAASLDALGAAPYNRRSRIGILNRTVLRAIFTWWNGATIGARFQIGRSSALVGEDEFGNRYYQARTTKGSFDPNIKRRYVIFKGYADASKVSPDWHGWLHHTFDEPPTTAPLKRRSWEKDYQPNLTGTVWAWRPKGSIARGGERQKASGDYQPWTPE